MKMWLSKTPNVFEKNVFENKAYIVSNKDDIDKVIENFCIKHNIDSCKFRVEGVAEIKKVVVGLGALFG